MRGKNSSSITSSAAAPGVKCVFVAMQQRANTIFCFNVGEGGGTTETHEILETVHRKTVLEWFKRFREKCEGPDDDPKSERLSKVRIFVNYWQSPTNDPQTDEGSATLNQETIRQILHRQLGERFVLQPDGRAKVPQRHDW